MGAGKSNEIDVRFFYSIQFTMQIQLVLWVRNGFRHASGELRITEIPPSPLIII